MGCGCSAGTESSGSVLTSKKEAKMAEIAKQMAVDCLKKYSKSDPEHLNREEAKELCKEFLPLQCKTVRGEMKMKNFNIDKDAPEMEKLALDMFNQFDKNQDGLLDVNELADSFKNFLREAKAYIDDRKEKEE